MWLLKGRGEDAGFNMRISSSCLYGRCFKIESQVENDAVSTYDQINDLEL